ncbi:MAG: DsbA family protein [Candidatus Methylomirabilales bacterium]
MYVVSQREGRSKTYDWRPWHRCLLCSIAAMGTLFSTALAQSQEQDDALALLARGPALGSESAPVTIIELSDFQCVFCAKFSRETLPSLEAEYVRPGKVRLVYGHLAILGRQSFTSAQAADCAAEQGKFWEYHDVLFASRGPFALTNGKLKGYAREIGLNGETFDRCLDSGKYAQKVKEETMAGLSLGARATPVFLINETMLVGAHPLETFREIIEEELQASRDRRAPERDR